MIFQTLCALSFLLATHVTFAQDSAIDPKAKQALDAMLRAYRDVRSLQQETVYTSSDEKASGVVRATLLMQRPNKLVMEMNAKDEAGTQALVSRFQSDGKSLYTYRIGQGWFTKEKAPKDMKGFQPLAMSVEMAAISGLDPVGAMLKQATSVQMAETVEVDGTPTDVVVIQMDSADRRAETRLYIGQKDHFLRRFTFHSEAVAKPQPEKPARQFDPDNPNDRPAPPPPPVNMAYDNHLIVDKPIGKDAFVWAAPAGTFQYQPGTVYTTQTGSHFEVGGKPGNTPGAPPNMKIITIQELMKKAKKVNGK